MTLQQLRYVVEISKCGSITAAAQNLFIAQPSLSKAVKDLEKEFSIIILERNRHGVAFTTEGMEFLSYANHILEQAHNMHDYFSYKENREEKIHLCVSAQHYMFAVDALISFIKQIEAHSRYTIAIRECRTSQVIQDVLSQRSQIGILFVSNVTHNFMSRLFVKNSLEFVPFRNFPPYVYLNCHHPLARKNGLTIEELASYPYVKYEQGMDSYLFSEELVLPDVSTNRTVYVTDRSTMLAILGSTHAYNIGTGCLLPGIVDDNIISVPLLNRIDQMKIGWIKLKNLTMASEMKAYVTLLSESLEKCTWGNNHPIEW